MSVQARGGALSGGTMSLVLAALASSWSPVQAHEIVYFGRATAAKGFVKTPSSTHELVLADVGMACTGDPREEKVAQKVNPSPLSFESNEIRSYTEGVNQTAFTETEMRQVSLEVSGLSLSADGMHSQVRAICHDDESISVEGGSVIDSLTVNGQTITVGTEPNQTLEIPGVATLTFNEQVRFRQELRVVGIRVKLMNANAEGDIALAAARAKIKLCDL